MGIVYKAEDTKLERTVALKFLAQHLLDDPEAKQRFLREAKAAAGIDHPNICHVSEIGEEEDKPSSRWPSSKARRLKIETAVPVYLLANQMPSSLGARRCSRRNSIAEKTTPATTRRVTNTPKPNMTRICIT